MIRGYRWDVECGRNLRKYEMGLKHIEEARSLMKPDSNPNLLTRLLNLRAILLTAAKPYQKSVFLRLLDAAGL